MYVCYFEHNESKYFIFLCVCVCLFLVVSEKCYLLSGRSVLGKIVPEVLKLWDFARLFGAITCVTLVFHREGEFSRSFFSLNSFVICCEINAAIFNLNGTAKTYRKRV